MLQNGGENMIYNKTLSNVPLLPAEEPDWMAWIVIGLMALVLIVFAGYMILAMLEDKNDRKR